MSNVKIQGSPTGTGNVTLVAPVTNSEITITLPSADGTLASAGSIGDGTLTMNTSGVGLSGSQTFTANQTGNATFTIASNATSVNTVSTVVARDASGNFSAGTITATLSGNASTATTATNQSGGTVSATTMTSSGRYTRNTTGGINSPSARFALTTSQQADYHIASSVNGSSPTNTQQYGITFSPSGGQTQAGILISENGSDGTAIGFFCTNSYAAGPQLRGSFDPVGNFVAAANVTAYSDERLKTDWSPLPVDFIDRLAKIKAGTYTRIDSGERQAGSSAQEWQKLLPEVVVNGIDADKTLSLAYGNAALVACVELAKEVVTLKAEIAALKQGK